ncbi:hypothetical protein GQ457_01G005440 [Hibiscus cannabinus]
MEEMNSESSDPRLPKKQRRRDEDPPDSEMECDVLSNQRPLLSYKDIVAGGNGPSPIDNNLGFDDDIELLEDDITISNSNGIPSIVFSERVQQLAIKSMDLALVVKVLGRRISYNVFRNRIFNIWKPSHPLKVMDIENNFFLVKFSDRLDYLKVLTQGPWTIFGHYLTVEPWSIDFQPLQASPSRLMAWIRLPGLPVTLYRRSFIEAIGSQIGNVIKIDFQTDNGCRGRFARMAVNINLKKPLVSKLMINGRLQIIEYESLPTVCFSCGIYGHLQDICPKHMAPSEDCSINRETVHTSPVPVEVPTPIDPYGPWMLVEKRRRNLRRQPAVNPVSTVNQNITPSINPLFEPTDAAPVTLPLPIIQEPNLDSSSNVTYPEVSHPIINVESNPTDDVDPSNRGKSKTRGKSALTITNSSGAPVGSRKGVVVAAKSLKTRLPISLNPMQGSRSFSRNGASSSSIQQNLSKSSVLDPVKHQAVKRSELDNPPIPSTVLAGTQHINGQSAMVE